MPSLGRPDVGGYLAGRGETVTVEDGVPGVPLQWNEASASRIALLWDGSRVRAEVVLPVDVPAAARRGELAAAVSAANRELKLVGFRIAGDRVLFSISAFLDSAGRVAPAVLDRLIAITRIAAKAYREKLVRASFGPTGKRTLGTAVSSRPAVFTERDRVALSAAVARDLPALAPPAGRPRAVAEIVQPFFAQHRVLEVELEDRLAIHVAVEPSGEMRVLTTHLDTLNLVASRELTGAELQDERVALAYAVHAGGWARPALHEVRLESLPGDPRVVPPSLSMHVAGHEVTFWVLSEGRLVRRSVVVAVFDAHLEIHDQVIAATSGPPS